MPVCACLYGTSGKVILAMLGWTVFNLLALAGFEGNLWAGAKARMGLFIDEKADERQRQALQSIFAGEAGGWPAGFAANESDRFLK
jgi:hypothetical protein